MSTLIQFVLGRLSAVVRRKSGNLNYITNFLFRLHSVLTCTSLLLFASLVLLQQVFQVHMSCLVPPEEDARPSAIIQYCFITGTYTVPSLHQSLLTPHPGIGNYSTSKEQKFHHYFQWVPFVLGIQGALFYIPYQLWKSVEKGRLRLYSDFKIGSRIKPLDKNTNDLQRSAIYFAKSQGYNKTYGWTFALCEVLNLFVVILTFYSTNWFLSGSFLHFGSDWLHFLQRDENYITSKINPVDKLFPKVTKCEFKKFGPSGSIISYDILCIMTVNVIHEKIYLILWFWLVGLFISDIFFLVFRFFLIISKSFRSFILLFFLEGNVTDENRSCIKSLLEKIGYCDWFLLRRISDSVDGRNFIKFCKQVLRYSETKEEKVQRKRYQNLMMDSDDNGKRTSIRYGGYAGAENSSLIRNRNRNNRSISRAEFPQEDDLLQSVIGGFGLDTLTRKRLQSDPLPEPENLNPQVLYPSTQLMDFDDVDAINSVPVGVAQEDHGEQNGRNSRMRQEAKRALGKSQPNIYS